LIITNDFPPRIGGIQSFLHALAIQVADRVVVYAPAWPGAAAFDGAQPFPVIRHPTSLMLPVPTVCRRALEIMASHGCDTILFGAAAPLGLLAPSLRRAGARRIVAVTHGHETGWARLPVSRALLRRIGDSVDALTYLGEFTRQRMSEGLSAAAIRRMVRLTPGADTKTFRPGAGGSAIRKRHGLTERPVILCVSRLVRRKGQDTLIRALPGLLAANQGKPALLLVGDGPYAAGLRRLARKLGVSDHVVFAGEVPSRELPGYYDAADIFAMPCRSRYAGLDVEGLGIVFLEAAAAALPVIVGDCGGAPDAVLHGETGFVVPGRGVRSVEARLNQLLSDPAAAKVIGQKGRAWMERSWQWAQVGRELRAMLQL
jgi:phosphatidylinositol alpha-1,6-mannosyltransferase